MREIPLVLYPPDLQKRPSRAASDISERSISDAGESAAVWKLKAISFTTGCPMITIPIARPIHRVLTTCYSWLLDSLSFCVVIATLARQTVFRKLLATAASAVATTC